MLVPPPKRTTDTAMRAVGNLNRWVAAITAAAFLISSFGTAWTLRAPSHSALVDPSLRAGEVALVQTTSGHAGALSMKLSALGAADVETENAANTVIARLSGPALAALATDPNVTIATRDIEIHSSGDGKKGGFEARRLDRGEISDLATTTVGDAGHAAIKGPVARLLSGGWGLSVAVMDTGVADHPDLNGKVTVRVDFVNDGNTALDPAGHGTFIAGLIGANGVVKGVAPGASIVSLRVLDATGTGTLRNVVAAFNWLLKNRVAYNIKVLNISWGASQATTYHKDLLAALVEAAWFSGVTVVAAAGNDGPNAGTVTSPAADPFIVTAGAFDDHGTADLSDDTYATFTGIGPTWDGFTKPEILAPGVHVLSLRSSSATYVDATGTPIGASTDKYVHMTGTSASAALVSGTAALIAAVHPTYTPTQIKGAIVASGRSISGSTTKAVDAAVAITVTPAAVNIGLKPSRMLLVLVAASHQLKVLGVTWEGVTWENVAWDSVTWEGVTWESVSWESVTWESVSWESVSWEGVTWEE
jgi:subtilisin family serine protease